MSRAGASPPRAGIGHLLAPACTPRTRRTSRRKPLVQRGACGRVGRLLRDRCPLLCKPGRIVFGNFSSRTSLDVPNGLGCPRSAARTRSHTALCEVPQVVNVLSSAAGQGAGSATHQTNFNDNLCFAADKICFSEHNQRLAGAMYRPDPDFPHNKQISVRSTQQRRTGAAAGLAPSAKTPGAPIWCRRGRQRRARVSPPLLPTCNRQAYPAAARQTLFLWNNMPVLLAL
jgi:hypothetical protein